VDQRRTARHCNAGPLQPMVEGITPRYRRDRKEGRAAMIDRTTQREVLEQLRDAFPAFLTFTADSDERQKLAANLAYLGQHGLIIDGIKISLDGHAHFGASTITARGIDFLEDDGGLSAILGTVTVKLHADTIRFIFEEKIEQSGLPPEEKSALRKHLADLPATALQAGMTQLVKLGAEHLPDAIQWLRTLAGL
jgi:hypothetical protein